VSDANLDLNERVSELTKEIARRQEAEAALQLALDSGHMGTWDWDIRTNRIVWSRTLEIMHGLQPGSFGGTLEDFKKDIHPDDRDRVHRAIDESLRRNAYHPLEYRLVWPNGSVHWVEGRGQVLRDEAGQPARMMGVCIDIDERKRTEQTLRFLADASAALAELVDYESTLQKIAKLAVPFFADWCAVDMLDADGTVRRLAVAHIDPAKIAMVNELARRYPPDPNAERGVYNVLRCGQAEIMEDIPDSLLVKSALDEEHLRAIRALGLRSYLCAPMRARGKIHGALTFVMAESGRRYRRDDLQVAEDLAHRAAVAVENAQLYHRLREADRRKDEFLATLAHELRNPLAPVRNGLQILRLAADKPEMMESTRQMMDRQLGHMVRLIDDLLDVSRITRGKIELRKERVELSAVVQSALEASRSALEAAGHELTVTPPRRAVYLDADATRLAQVIGNLLNNAARYTPPGGHIWLNAEREDGEAVVRVRDTGLGIPPEMRMRVFEMFTQVNRQLERSQGGLGIGLALVRSLVHLHGGSIEARSAGLNQGSEFIVRLPLAADGEAVSPANRGNEQANRHPAHRIVVVDDNADAAETLAMLLRMMNNEVWVAHDGPEGIELARRQRPDLIFLDIGLPSLSGYEVARRLRQEAALAGVTLIALTGWGQPEDRRRSREAGFDEHLVKPVDPELLAKVLSPHRSSGDVPS
jgi:PAS domain S-box-containing protein